MSDPSVSTLGSSPPAISEALSPAEERFEAWRKRLGAVLTPVAFFVVYALTPGLKPEGRKLAGILAAVAVLWMTEFLPLPVTALVGAILCVAFGVAPAKTVLAYFADPIVFLFIGSFILARAMINHRLDRRIALAFLSIPWVGRSPARILACMGLVTAVVSMWVSNAATTSMMLPVGLGVLGAMHQARGGSSAASNEPISARRWPYATGMMLMIAYASSVGGMGTPVGSPPNLICIGFIRSAHIVRDGVPFDISFLKWMALCMPLMLVMLLVLLGLLYSLHREHTPMSTDALAQYVVQQRSTLGPWSRGQINTSIAFAVAVALWIVPGILALPLWGHGELSHSVESIAKWMNARFPEAIAALIAAVLLFVLPVDAKQGEFTITWREAVQIDWGTILLFGGGLALGTLMADTGVAAALGDSLNRQFGVSSLWSITALAIAFGIILSEATSNTAASNMVIPVVIGICQTAHISPIPPALGACLGASYGFMLPVSTPPNAIVYGSGLVPIQSMIRAGILFDILGFFMIWGGLRVMCPLLGLM